MVPMIFLQPNNSVSAQNLGVTNFARDDIYAPYLTVPFSDHISDMIDIRKGDKRLLGPMMEAAVAASELALQSAGLNRDHEARGDYIRYCQLCAWSASER